MAIKTSSKKCFTASHKQSFQKLANYVMSHYPKDTNLHKAVRGTFKAMDDAAVKLSKATSKKRAMPKRRSAKRAAPKRRTAKRSAPKRRSMKRSPPKRRRAMRRRRAA
ncbi:MAG: hypothetical protein E2O73_06365 [Deltaproteobacteria bacterium]|nr:MAG: hypothetical protein E2O73_06365 [Deltaproteobacteria bacterium]TDJ09699.1 MAG: hypothetical protein E2O71_01605 [Deltaproteobacteria bacterium]